MFFAPELMRVGQIGLRTLQNWGQAPEEEGQRPTVTGWKPKTKERRLFFLSSCKQLRLEFLRYFEAFCSTCRELYKAWKAGTYPKDWPPEAYLPQHP